MHRSLRLPISRLWPALASSIFTVLLSLAAVGFPEAASAQTSAGDLALTVASPTNRVPSGQNVTLRVDVTNAGPSTANGVVLVATISAKSVVVSSLPTVGSCSLAGSVLTCQLGAMASGDHAAVAITLQTAAGANNVHAQVSAIEADPHPADNVSEGGVLGYATQEWVNADATLGPDESEGPVDIYPMTIFVSGQTSRIDKVTVTLNGLSHEWPDDFDILLVGPGGQKVMLMSDCGLDNVLLDATLTFDDDAAELLPNNDPPIVSGTYRPTNYDRLSDDFDPPAPRDPYATNLTVFRGTVANGTWSLYIMDDSPENQGYLTDGWSLHFELVDPEADVRVSATGPASLQAGRSALYEVTVTNAGPASSATTLRYELPPGFRLVNTVASQGACTLIGSMVICNLGSVGAGERANVFFDTVPANGGTFTNRYEVLTPLVDPAPTNNSFGLVTTVSAASDLVLVSPTPDSQITLGQTVVTQFGISNAGPSITAVVMSMIVTPGLSIVSSSTSVGSCVNLEGTVACDFGIMPAGATATVSVTSRGTAVGESRAVSRLDGTAIDPFPGNNTVVNNVTILRGTPQAPTISAIERVSNGLAIRFQSEIARRYTLEYKSVLTNGAWTALGAATGDGNQVSLVDTNAAANSRFYRVRAE